MMFSPVDFFGQHERTSILPKRPSGAWRQCLRLVEVGTLGSLRHRRAAHEVAAKSALADFGACITASNDSRTIGFSKAIRSSRAASSSGCSRKNDRTHRVLTVFPLESKTVSRRTSHASAMAELTRSTRRPLPSCPSPGGPRSPRRVETGLRADRRDWYAPSSTHGNTSAYQGWGRPRGASVDLLHELFLGLGPKTLRQIDDGYGHLSSPFIEDGHGYRPRLYFENKSPRAGDVWTSRILFANRRL